MVTVDKRLEGIKKEAGKLEITLTCLLKLAIEKTNLRETSNHLQDFRMG